MSKKLRTRSAIFAALLAAWGASGAALAVDEVEPNTPVTSAQPLVFGPDGTVTVYGVIGTLSGAATFDVDLYTFQGHEGDIVTLDIDGAWKADFTGLDANMALFGPFGSDPYHIYAQDDDASSVDPGSVDIFDPRIDSFRLPVTGTYVVGVSGSPASFIDINTVTTNSLELNSNGAYTLIITRVAAAPAVLPINIEIKPGSSDVPPINPKAKGSIPVALLSAADFNALQVDRQTLTFGETGNEASLLRCDKDGTDVNGDGRLDLVCHFDNVTAKFSVGDTEGVVRGKTSTGTPFEGKGWLKVVSGKRRTR